MSKHRSLFLPGLFLTLRRLPAVLWAYVINLGLALIFSMRVHAQLGAVMNHSLYTQRLVSGFDLGVLAESIMRLNDGPAPFAGGYSAVPLYVALYFILVPGALFCYQTGAPARLSTLLHQGVLHFWRFVRITILALLAFAIIVGPLFALAGKWAEHVDDHAVGFHAFLARMAGYTIVLLVATIVRLYFDLVEVYTVQLGANHARRNGRPDRRVRLALGPAWRALRRHFTEVWPAFLFLLLLGAGAVIVTGRIALHSLASPHMWPSFVLAQIGLFLLLFTRFWQRAAETTLSLDDPAFLPVPIEPSSPFVPRATPPPPPVALDPIPNPEPAAPAMDTPDAGIYESPDEPPVHEK